MIGISENLTLDSNPKSIYLPSRFKTDNDEKLILNQKNETKNFLKLFGLVTLSESLEIKKNIKNKQSQLITQDQTKLDNSNNKTKRTSEETENLKQADSNTFSSLLIYSPPVTRRKRAELNRSSS